MCSVNTDLSGRLETLVQEAKGKYSKEVREKIVDNIYREAENIAKRTVVKPPKKLDWDGKIDNILTSRITGYPIMLLLLGVIFWITIVGANYPSQMLFKILFWGEEKISTLFYFLGMPQWLHGFLVLEYIVVSLG